MGGIAQPTAAMPCGRPPPTHTHTTTAMPSFRLCVLSTGTCSRVIWSLVCMCEELWSPFCMAGHVCRCCVEYVPGTERMLLGTWPGLVNDLCLCPHTHTYTVSPHRYPSLHFNHAVLVCAATLSCCVTKHPHQINLPTVTPRPAFLAHTQPQLHITNTCCQIWHCAKTQNLHSCNKVLTL